MSFGNSWIKAIDCARPGNIRHKDKRAHVCRRAIPVFLLQVALFVFYSCCLAWAQVSEDFSCYTAFSTSSLSIDRSQIGVGESFRLSWCDPSNPGIGINPTSFGVDYFQVYISESSSSGPWSPIGNRLPPNQLNASFQTDQTDAGRCYYFKVEANGKTFSLMTGTTSAHVVSSNAIRVCVGSQQCQVSTLTLSQIYAELSTRVGQTVNANNSTIRIEQKDFGDSCLGCPQSGQYCLQVITTGSEITITFNGRTYTYKAYCDSSSWKYCGATQIPCPDITFANAPGTLQVSSGGQIQLAGVVQAQSAITKLTLVTKRPDGSTSSQQEISGAVGLTSYDLSRVQFRHDPQYPTGTWRIEIWVCTTRCSGCLAIASSESRITEEQCAYGLCYKIGEIVIVVGPGCPDIVFANAPGTLQVNAGGQTPLAGTVQAQSAISKLTLVYKRPDGNTLSQLTVPSAVGSTSFNLSQVPFQHPPQEPTGLWRVEIWVCTARCGSCALPVSGESGGAAEQQCAALLCYKIGEIPVNVGGAPCPDIVFANPPGTLQVDLGSQVHFSGVVQAQSAISKLTLVVKKPDGSTVEAYAVDSAIGKTNFDLAPLGFKSDLTDPTGAWQVEIWVCTTRCSTCVGIASAESAEAGEQCSVGLCYKIGVIIIIVGRCPDIVQANVPSSLEVTAGDAIALSGRLTASSGITKLTVVTKNPDGSSTSEEFPSANNLTVVDLATIRPRPIPNPGDYTIEIWVCTRSCSTTTCYRICIIIVRVRPRPACSILGTPQGALDSPLNNAVVSGDVAINGWAAIVSGATAGVPCRVELIVDGVLAAQLATGYARIDVQQYFSNKGISAPNNLGFGGSWDSRSVTDGNHRLSIRAADAAGSAAETAAEIVAITVVTRNGNAGCGAHSVAQRSLPNGYVPGQPVQVSIQVNPPAGTQNYAVEETPPTNWTISGVDNNGQFDAQSRKVKWGPFFDSQARTLRYTATPPAGSSGDKSFSGIISLDGKSQPICGSTSIPLTTANYHPADTNENWRMAVDELTAYGAAWKRGDNWQRPPNPIPIDYVTNAGLLWKSGEVYHYAAGQNPPWQTGPASVVEAVAQAAGRQLQEAGGTLVSSFDAPSYTPGVGLKVSIQVTPDAGTQVYAVEDTPPVDWVISSINNGGQYDGTNKKIKWGPFFDNQVRTLTYTATPPAGAIGPKTFSGVGSFDGTSVPVTGMRSIATASSAMVALDFPQVAVGGGYRAYLMLNNPSTSAIQATVNFMFAGGQALTLQINGTAGSSRSFSIPAKGSVKLALTGRETVLSTGWCQVTGSGVLGGVLTYQLVNGQDVVSQASVPVAVRARSFLIAVPQLGGATETGLAMANVEDQTAQLTLRFWGLDGGVAAETTITLGAGQQIARFVSQFFSGAMSGREGILEVTSNRNLAAVGLVFQGNTFATLPVMPSP